MPAGDTGDNNIVNNLNQTDKDNTNTKTPGCTNPPHYQTTTAFIDSAATISQVGQIALCKIAAVQENSKILGTPNGASVSTTQTVELLLPKLPLAARKAYRVPNIAHNLVAVSELCDPDCSVYFHKHGVEIEFRRRGHQQRLER